MRATKFEFEQRFWIIGAIFGLGFACYSFDQTNAAEWLVHKLSNSDGPRELFLLRLTIAFGAALIFFCAFLRTWATAYLRTDVVHDAQQHSDELVADGPYRFVRNPLYFANVPMAAGIGLMASRSGWIFLTMGMWLFLYRLIFREEYGLLQSQGESYCEYLRKVPRFWPGLSPRVPSSGLQPRWGQAIAGEMIFWLFGLAQLCFAITLNMKLAGIVFLSSFAFYFIVVPMVKRRTAPSCRPQIPS
jgi:protein-S-isoprenylcysteine O-methyltransferase Ste14